LGADLGPLGRVWAAVVARRWEQVVTGTVTAVQVEAERRTLTR
jgi:hypothetical protein